MQLKFARLRDRDIDLILVPLDSAFGAKPRVEQQLFIDRVSQAARDLQLRGIVVPVWDKGDGGLGFRAPLAMQPYLRTLSLREIISRLDGILE